jgi:hypothetical protein
MAHGASNERYKQQAEQYEEVENHCKTQNPDDYPA